MPTLIVLIRRLVKEATMTSIRRMFLEHQTHPVSKTFCSLQGFPSGHTSSAFAAATFLTLYLNGKLKTFADYASDFWVIIITIIPLILASLVAGAQYTSHVSSKYSLLTRYFAEFYLTSNTTRMRYLLVWS